MAPIRTLLVRLALRAWPRRFRMQYGDEMELAFDDLYARMRARGRLAALKATLATCRSVLASGIAERLTGIRLQPGPASRPEDTRMTIPDLRSACDAPGGLQPAEVREASLAQLTQPGPIQSWQLKRSRGLTRAWTWARNNDFNRPVETDRPRVLGSQI